MERAEGSRRQLSIYTKKNPFSSEQEEKQINNTISTFGRKSKEIKTNHLNNSQNIPFNHQSRKVVTPTEVLQKGLMEIGKNDADGMQRIGVQFAATLNIPMPEPKVMTLEKFNTYLNENKIPNHPLFKHLDENDEIAILLRGCRPDQLLRMVSHQSAGNAPWDPNTRAPTEKEAVGQVGEQASYPEFTENKKIAKQFGKNNFVVAFAIPKKYLAKGSESETGWICHNSAPALLISWKDSFKLF